MCSTWLNLPSIPNCSGGSQRQSTPPSRGQSPSLAPSAYSANSAGVGEGGAAGQPELERDSAVGGKPNKDAGFMRKVSTYPIICYLLSLYHLGNHEILYEIRFMREAPL